mmetsp:Transcript_555/g.1296  ORF Transcript_555/g.1296 Transcript_555/m.1296 type:complete len:257 (-) Transcript_555:105-875(-)
MISLALYYDPAPNWASNSAASPYFSLFLLLKLVPPLEAAACWMASRERFMVVRVTKPLLRCASWIFSRTAWNALLTALGWPRTSMMRGAASSSTPRELTPPWLLLVVPPVPCCRCVFRLCPVTTTRAPVACWMPWMAAPPRPMTAPTQCAGHTSVFVTDFASSRTISSMTSRQRSTLGLEPTTMTRRGCSSSMRSPCAFSTCTRAPVSLAIWLRPLPRCPNRRAATRAGTSRLRCTSAASSAATASLENFAPSVPL